MENLLIYPKYIVGWIHLVQKRHDSRRAVVRKTIMLLLVYYYYYYYYYYYLTAIGLSPGGSSTVHIYAQTGHRIQRTEHTYQLKRKKLEKE
jgi:hypothetical protein